MQKLMITATLLFLASCVDFRGEYTSEREVSLIHTTMFGNQKEKLIPAGNHRTDFRLNEISNKLRLSFKTGQGDINVKIKMPKNIDIPRRNGAFFLDAETTGQNFDIQGTVSNDRSRSRTYDRTESCRYRVYRRVCRNVRRCRTDDDGNRHCRTVRRCSNQPRYYSGRRDVRYHYVNVSEGFKLELLEKGSNTEVATFDGHDSESQRVYDYRGPCLRYGYGGDPRRPYPRH